jgi:hypothetical protein
LDCLSRLLATERPYQRIGVSVHHTPGRFTRASRAVRWPSARIAAIWRWTLRGDRGQQLQ